jgi:hypothetical protein
MKRIIAVLFCLLIPISAVAQQRTGNIYGTVVDTDNNPLPGVSVTLTGKTIAPITTTTNEEGRFRFLSLFPANDYEIKVELQGFKTRIETGIIVNVARNADIVVALEQGALEEQVTVVAQTPVVDTKKTQVTHTVSYEMLQDLPSARDPWVVLQMTPSIQMDRENIGGVESGQQSSYVARASSTQEWTVDGMQITDLSSGGTPGYFDFDSLEEMNISTGTLDVEHRDPGIVVNMVTRRGGNKVSLGGRFYWTNAKFQSTISDAKLAELNLIGYNRANDIKDFGFNAGGPIVKDKAWWWISYGINQVKTYNAVNVADDTYLNNYNGKLNFQLIPSNRLEILYQLGDKTKFGRSSSETFLPGWRQGSTAYFGNPTVKIQDEQMIGQSLFLSVRAGSSNGGFGMRPENDLNSEKIATYDYAGGYWYNSYWWFYSDRPHPYGVVQAQYFNDNLFGMAHEMKVGFEVNNNKRVYTGVYYGNGNLNIFRDYNTRTVDWNGDGTRDVVLAEDGFDLQRISIRRYDTATTDGTRRLAAYFSDTISAGRFNFNIGFRFDHANDYRDEALFRGLWLPGQEAPTAQMANYAALTENLFGSAAAVSAIAALLPDSTRPAVESIKTFWFFSPRLGVTYDLFGDGKTVLKAAYTLYPGGGLGTQYNSPFGTGGTLHFWWADGFGFTPSSPDGVASLDELYWASFDSTRTPYHAFDAAGNFVGNTARESGYMYSGFTWGSTSLQDSRSLIDLANWKTSLTHEVNLSVEREIFADFGVSLGFNWKRMGRFSWSPEYYPELDHLRSKDDYLIAGTVPDTLTNGLGDSFDPGEAAGKPWYLLTGGPEGQYTEYSKTVMMDSQRHNTYWGIDLVLTKRLTNRWMMNGSVTYQSQKSYFGDNGYLDPTNLWASEGQIYAFDMGGSSGKTTRPFFTRWMFKLSGLYQFPYDINVSGTVSAHQGTFYQTYFYLEDDTWPNPDSYYNSMPTTTFNNRERLGDVWVINFKVEKAFKIGNVGKMYLSADLFNAFNSLTILRKRDIQYGTFYYASNVFDGWSEGDANSGFNNEVLNPLLLRLGLRFQF